MVDFSHVKKQLHFKGVLTRIINNEFVSRDELATLLRTRDGVEVPEPVLDYIAQHLAGEIKAPKGRKALDTTLVHWRDMIIEVEYPRLQAALRSGKLTAKDIEIYGEENPTFAADHTISERAAGLLAEKLLAGRRSYHQIQTIASSKK